MKEFAELRLEIDWIDDKIGELLDRRAGIVKAIGRIKNNLHIPVEQAGRENAIIERITHQNYTHIPPKSLESIFHIIFREMKTIQQ